MNKAILITVRTGSSRLPNKPLLKINGKSTIQYLIDGVKKSKLADKIILCTTDLEQDKILCDIASANEINYFQGDELNKLKRWYGACDKFNIDFFVTADGDDLFYDAGLADLCFEQIDDDFVDGQGLYNDVYGINTMALKNFLQIEDRIIEPHHMSDIFRLWNFNVSKLKNIPDIYIKKDIRMTLDYPDDLKFFTNVINHFGDEKFGLVEIINYINKNPEVGMINYHHEREWKENQK
tara:strand:+ start:1468 stop:2178 length:711 start_codon:yes stop_codon:yes gene_type:complete